MSGKKDKQLRRTIRHIRGNDLTEFYNFINAQKFSRRVKLALLIIKGNINTEKMNKI